MAKNNFNLFNNVSDMLRTFIDRDNTPVKPTNVGAIDFGQTIYQSNITPMTLKNDTLPKMTYGKLKNYNGTSGSKTNRTFTGIADYSTVVNKKSKGSRSFADLFGTK